MENLIQSIIESPKGGSQKFDYDPSTGSFTLTKQLPSGMVFPFDFGFIPGTIGEDGDPLDVLILSDAPTFTGCRVNCRIIGSLNCEQTEKDGKKMRNDRYIGIADISKQYVKIEKLSELPKELTAEMESFFTSYNELAGKEFKVTSKVGPSAALAQIKKSRANDIPTSRLEIFLPLATSDGEKFPKDWYSKLEKELTDRFGGLTSYSRVPVEGFWEKDGKSTQQPMVIYEVLLSVVDQAYWSKVKERLEKQFDQQEILITHGKMAKI